MRQDWTYRKVATKQAFEKEVAGTMNPKLVHDLGSTGAYMPAIAASLEDTTSTAG